MESRNFNPEHGNEKNWSLEGWKGEWRRIGVEWWQYRIFDPKGKVRTPVNWIDYKNPFHSNLLNEMKRTAQHYASLDACDIAQIHTVTFN